MTDTSVIRLAGILYLRVPLLLNSVADTDMTYLKSPDPDPNLKVFFLTLCSKRLLLKYVMKKFIHEQRGLITRISRYSSFANLDKKYRDRVILETRLRIRSGARSHPDQIPRKNVRI
jgi:hypothetical protein